jgi:predicted nucleic acid-binding protein
MNAVDTNVLIYAADSDDRQKGPVAVALLDRLTKDPTPPVLLWQVFCEFTAFIAKARQRVGAGPEAFEYVRAVRDRFPLVVPRPDVAGLAIDIHLTEQVSIWDALLLAACADAGVTRLYSEDVQSKPIIRGIEIINPFAPAP